MSNRTSTNETPSLLKNCLRDIDVPPKMIEGVSVIKIDHYGRRENAFLTLSNDKFTTYVTTNKFKRRGAREKLSRPLLQKFTSIGSADEEKEFERNLDIGSIDRIQSGQNTLRFERARNLTNRISTVRKNVMNMKELEPGDSFSIVFNSERTLDFTVTDKEISRDEIVETFSTLLHAYCEAKGKASKDILLLRYVWLDSDKDGSDTINASELSNILSRINFYMKKSDVDKQYKEFWKHAGLDRKMRNKGLAFDQVGTLLHKFKRDMGTWHVNPVKDIMQKLFGEVMNNFQDRTIVSVESFLQKFMLKKQGESHTTVEDVENLFVRLNKLEVAKTVSSLRLRDKDSNYIDKDLFEAYLFSSENDVFDPSLEEFKPESMTRPLSEYWINSSHNTYLTGDQLKSRSSVEMYMNALYRGCRCLELDCFDGGRSSGDYRPIPIVYHGLTITTKILFSDVLVTIKAFLNCNPDCYPITLSLENHCSIPFQEEMARCLINILDKNLYIPKEGDLYRPLPSPEALKGMVLLKGKRESGIREEDDEDSDGDTDSDISAEHTVAHVGEPQIQTIVKQASTAAPTLAKITMFQGKRLHNFSDSVQKGKNDMHSFDESKARSLCKENKRGEWATYNQTHLSRVYPSGRRLDSSNFNPISAWSAGSQLVALNFQTNDFSRRLNDGRFRQNGQCGYVLKPKSLLSTSEESILPKIKSMSIKIISGSCLPKPKGSKKGESIDPYVNMALFDVPNDGDNGKEIVQKMNTISVPNNGFNPIWTQQNYCKFRVQNSDVAMVQLTVWHRDISARDGFIASASFPINCMREGYRSVQLFDANNKRNGAFECAALLIEVKISYHGQKQIKMW